LDKKELNKFVQRPFVSTTSCFFPKYLLPEFYNRKPKESMSMIFTSTHVLSPFYEQDLHLALETLREGGLALIPTDTCWSVVCLIDAVDSLDRLLRLKRQKHADHFELMVNSMAMFKNHVKDLHPRLETLLAYHLRPLSILFEEPLNLPVKTLNSRGQITVRLVKDQFSQDLIEALGAPLISSFAHVAGSPEPLNFGAISSEILQGVNFTAKYRQNDKNTDELPVMVKLLEDEEELEFLRE
jgi:L-threonylcarbamoyladenylate synthase